METNIIYGPRDISFKVMIQSVLVKGKLKQKYINLLLDEESLQLYDLAFTNAEADPEKNYEFFETLGDSTVNNCIVWYLFRRFPNMNGLEGKAILSRLKQQLVSKKAFYGLANKLNFWDFVTVDEKSKTQNKQKILEDVFEAFFGVTQHILDIKIKFGVGHAICYEIIQTLMDETEIDTSYEFLFDSKTRLKEVFDFTEFKTKGIGMLKYTAEKGEDNMFTARAVRIYPDGREFVIGSGRANLKIDAEKNAANIAIENLKKIGFVKEVPEIYKKFAQKVSLSR
jgi:dsRNA-specific ribonuclease